MSIIYEEYNIYTWVVIHVYYNSKISKYYDITLNEIWLVNKNKNCYNNYEDCTLSFHDK